MKISDNIAAKMLILSTVPKVIHLLGWLSILTKV